MQRKRAGGGCWWPRVPMCTVPHRLRYLLSTSTLRCAGLVECLPAQRARRAGVGRVGIADSDTVSLDNLHRQVGHTEARVGTHKTASLRTAASSINSAPDVCTHDDGVTPDNALALCRQYDVVADCSDNPYTRYLVNDACVLAGVPLVSAAAVGTDGQLSVYGHDGGPCYRSAQLHTSPPALLPCTPMHHTSTGSVTLHASARRIFTGVPMVGLVGH